MKETIFEQVAAAASVLKLDLSSGVCAVCRRPRTLGSGNGGCAEASLLSQRKEAADHNSDFAENEPSSHKGTQDI